MSARQRIERATGMLLVTAIVVMPWTAVAQQPRAPPAASDSTLELAKKTQNPIADLISLPLQNNLNFGYGAKDAPQAECLQPVVPVLARSFIEERRHG